MMMANVHRGEISAKLDGQAYVLCLTLGALAELESAFEAENLSALMQRLSGGNISAGDMLNIVTAGLRGAGHTFSAEEVAEMRAEGGAVGFVKIVSDLLAATFGTVADEARQ